LPLENGAGPGRSVRGGREPWHCPRAGLFSCLSADAASHVPTRPIGVFCVGRAVVGRRVLVRIVPDCAFGDINEGWKIHGPRARFDTLDAMDDSCPESRKSTSDQLRQFGAGERLRDFICKRLGRFRTKLSRIWLAFPGVRIDFLRQADVGLAATSHRRRLRELPSLDRDSCPRPTCILPSPADNCASGSRRWAAAAIEARKKYFAIFSGFLFTATIFPLSLSLGIKHITSLPAVPPCR
jgi:hypothetical protein